MKTAAHILCWALLAALAFLIPGSDARPRLTDPKEETPLYGTWSGTCKQRWYYAPTNSPSLQQKWEYSGGQPICTDQAIEYKYTVEISYSGGLVFKKSVSSTKFKSGGKQYTFPNKASWDTQARTDTYYKYALDGGSFVNGWACTDNYDDTEHEWGFKLTTENGKQVYYESSMQVPGGTGDVCAKTTKVNCNTNVVPTRDDNGNHNFGTTVCKLYKV